MCVGTDIGNASFRPAADLFVHVREVLLQLCLSVLVFYDEGSQVESERIVGSEYPLA